MDWRLTSQQSGILIAHIKENTTLISQNPKIINLILNHTIDAPANNNCTGLRLTEDQSTQLIKIIYENSTAIYTFPLGRHSTLYDALVKDITERYDYLFNDYQAVSLRDDIISYTKYDTKEFYRNLRNVLGNKSEFKPIIKHLKNDWINRIVGTLIVVVPWIIFT